MSTYSEASSRFAQRALSHIQVIAKGGRGSTTAAEKGAAKYVEAQLKAMGYQDVCQQPFSGERSMWLFIALAFGLALVGHAAYWLLRQPAGDLPALIISLLALGFSGYIIWRKFSLQDYPLHRMLPHAPSQNVIAKFPPAGEARQRLVLVAHLDSHRAVFWFATDFLVWLFQPISLAAIYGVYLAIPVYLLAAFTHWQVFTWLGLFLVLLHFIAWFTGVTADLGRYSPGANDNASGVGTLLALAERLKEQPLHNTEIWLVFTGCEESGGDGMFSLIKEYGTTLTDSVFVDFEMVGIGDSVSYIRVEGNLARFIIPSEIEALMKEVGRPYGVQPADAMHVGGSTESNILLKYGFRAVSLIAYQHGSSRIPEWHRLTDTPDRVQVSSLERVHALGWDILQRFDQTGISSQLTVE